MSDGTGRVNEIAAHKETHRHTQPYREPQEVNKVNIRGEDGYKIL